MSIIERAAQRMDKKRDAARAADVPTQPVVAQTPVDPVVPVAEAHALAPVVIDPVIINPVVIAPAIIDPVSAAPVAPSPAPAAPVLAKAASDTSARTGKATRKVDIDLARLRDMGMVTAAGGRTSLVEDFRIIKRPLLKRAFTPQAAGERPGNLIMVTSSLPGEGKTYCAINLAMSIAMELDHTVLLIDADVARPSVMSRMGLPNQRGLMDLLVDDKLDLSDVLLKTNVETLSLLPAGTATPRATELLASQMMSSFVAEIASRYPDRIVIFDSPPLLLTSEAHVLASHMGQIVVVVESEKTTQHAVQEALRQLEGLNNVNLIYNKSREFPGVEETYDYHYG